MNKTFVAAVAAMMMVAGSANALTLKKGEVIGSDGNVAKASETANGKARLADDGVLVAGGVVYIDLNGTTIEVDLDDIRGKSKEQIGEVIGQAAVDQLTDLHDDAQAHVDEIIAEGGDALNAVALTAEEIADHIKNSDAVEGAIVGVSEQAHAAVQEILADEIVIDAMVKHTIQTMARAPAQAANINGTGLRAFPSLCGGYLPNATRNGLMQLSGQ